jgi:hypothetical protein
MAFVPVLRISDSQLSCSSSERLGIWTILLIWRMVASKREGEGRTSDGDGKAWLISERLGVPSRRFEGGFGAEEREELGLLGASGGA